MNKINLEVGQTLIVELDGKSVLGRLCHVASGRSFIRLENVRDLATNDLQGNQCYYNSEIRNIKIVEDGERTTQSNDERTGEETKPTRSVKQLTLENLNNAIDKIQMCLYIHQLDVRYHDSIRFLKKQTTIAMAMEDVDQGRHSESPSLLSIATNSKIFIFDIKLIKITNDLKELLSSDRYMRILYNGRFVRDALQYKFNIVLGRCFDIMVAHIAICKANSAMGTRQPIAKISDTSFEACVEHYLKLPQNFFDNSITYESRPMRDNVKREAAKHVAFLLALQKHFVNEIMLEPFYRSCDKYINSLACISDPIDCLSETRSDGSSAITAVEPFALAIPFGNESNGTG
ncbi:piRNA biogenesis protein EXD1-like [Anopheles bellator]|uniref:piRNA biogenesis protein EXD1-like n=1 Tax=Anopheles bellator TaxID=139047 RepID=UPI002647E36F|nr:piRNA biogenesis protein EXD1-like [Anopheles bellator]